MRVACTQLGGRWRGCIVPLMIDNRTACGALRRCWSGSEPLQDLLEQIQQIATVNDFVLEPHWICSADNVLADALSRFSMTRFWAAVSDLGVAAQDHSVTWREMPTGLAKGASRAPVGAMPAQDGITGDGSATGVACPC